MIYDFSKLNNAGNHPVSIKSLGKQTIIYEYLIGIL
jgi:hypothetical protein